jgi:hypothetical protein
MTTRTISKSKQNKLHQVLWTAKYFMDPDTNLDIYKYNICKTTYQDKKNIVGLAMYHIGYTYELEEFYKTNNIDYNIESKVVKKEKIFDREFRIFYDLTLFNISKQYFLNNDKYTFIEGKMKARNTLQKSGVKYT